jgi:ABC-type uncharacterized transport system substrate-binding protein
LHISALYFSAEDKADHRKGARVMLQRRHFLTMLAGTVFPAVIARSQTKKPLVPILEGTSEAAAYPYLEPFTATLRERGLIEGETIEVLRRFADGDAGRYRAIAEELVNRKPAVIVTGSTTATLAW